MDDWQLLNEYRTRNSEEAFRALAVRYGGMVYHAALRQVRDPHLAQDVTQAVFIALTHKAPGLSNSVVLSGWLLRATRFAVLNLSRQETRRRRHEQEAFAMQTSPESSDAGVVWDQISPHLDEALHRLSKTDRDAVAIRFFESKSHKEVGQALGVSEEAAKRRVARAVEKLRLIFARRGIVAPVAVLAAAFTAGGAQAAPAGLASSVATAAAANSSVITPTLTIAKGILRLMAWTKLKTTVVLVAGALLAVGTATLTLHAIRQRQDDPGHDYSWQVEKPVVNFTNHAYSTMGRARPQVTILPAKFKRKIGYLSSYNQNEQGQGAWQSESQASENSSWHEFVTYNSRPNANWLRTAQVMGLDMTVKSIIGMVYSTPPTWTLYAAPLPQQRYDFIANLPDGAVDALREVISAKFGLAISRQMRDTDVLILSVRNPSAAALQPTTREGAFNSGQGHFWGQGRGAINQLAQSIQNQYLHLPVINQTGLPDAAFFAIDLRWNATAREQFELLNQALIDQAGLELTPTNLPIEMLVVEKAR